MKKIYQIIVGGTMVSLVVTLFALFAWYLWYENYISSITVVAEGIVDEMYIDISGQLFSSKTSYFVMISGKAVEISEKAYNMIHIGDFVRVFANKSAVIL